jgi:hypothetical protein
MGWAGHAASMEGEEEGIQNFDGKPGQLRRPER